MCSAFETWKRYDPKRQQLIKLQINRVLGLDPFQNKRNADQAHKLKPWNMRILGRSFKLYIINLLFWSYLTLKYLIAAHNCNNFLVLIVYH